jgi:hypothetical protein
VLVFNSMTWLEKLLKEINMYFLVYSNETGNLVDILYSAEELQRKFHPEQVTVHVIHV